MILYFGLSHPGDRYKPLIEKYGLLRNLPELTIFGQWCLGFYDKSTFEEPK